MSINQIQKAYKLVCDVFNCVPSDVMMVTANETSGDLEAALALGMKAQEIRGLNCPATIEELSDKLGC